MRGFTLPVLALTVAGCALAPVPDENRHYTLSPVTQPSAAHRTTVRTIGLAPVRLPPYLDRPQLVTRTGPERVEVASHDRWAAPLDALFVRALAEDLRDAVPADEVLAWPWHTGAAVDWVVAVEVQRFEREGDGTAVLDARWAVSRRVGGEVVERGRTVSRVPAADRQMASSVGALSRSVADLAHDVASGIVRALSVAEPR